MLTEQRSHFPPAIDPAQPDLSARHEAPSQTWRTFLDNHIRSLVSVDFFTVPTVLSKVLLVFVVLTHDRRRVVHVNVTDTPTAEWSAQLLVEAFPWDESWRPPPGARLVLEADRAPSEGPMPLRLIGLVEDDTLVAGCVDPGARTQFGVELAGAPACIADDEERPSRASPGGHSPQDVNVRRDGESAANAKRVRDRVVVGMQHDEPGPLHRSTRVKVYGAGNSRRVQTCLLKHCGQRHISDGIVHDEAHGAVRVVTHHVDDGVVEVGIMEVRRGDQQLAGETPGFHLVWRRVSQESPGEKNRSQDQADNTQRSSQSPSHPAVHPFLGLVCATTALNCGVTLVPLHAGHLRSPSRAWRSS